MAQHDISLVPPSSVATTLFDHLPPTAMIVASREELAAERPSASEGESIFIVEMTDERFGYYRIKDKSLPAYDVESAAALHNAVYRGGRTKFRVFNFNPFVAAYYL